ncbi:MAG: DUF3293 domain-containing protein [Leptospiraceae bacterium]|nr:DUF3293 domain-containing protein [Leptospiraceae bacterium]MCP5511054.1 DUF3293 domain-containing protein [Leptospiraceae bacterium]
MPEDEILNAYQKTDYIVFDGKKSFLLNVGLLPNEEWINYLKSRECNFFFFITAWNPFSIPHDPLENRYKNQILESEIQKQEFPYLMGLGKSQTSEWEEESFCVLGGNLEIASRFCRDYSQHAVLIGEPNKAPELHFPH